MNAERDPKSHEQAGPGAKKAEASPSARRNINSSQASRAGGDARRSRRIPGDESRARARGNAPGADYEVGFCKPPIKSRFQTGQSGNPGGRRKTQSTEDANALMLKEAYRLVTVREGNKVMRMPIIQAVMRSIFAAAARGNAPAQRSVLAILRTIGQSFPAPATEPEEAAEPQEPVSDAKLAQALVAVFNRAPSGAPNEASWPDSA